MLTLNNNACDQNSNCVAITADSMYLHIIHLYDYEFNWHSHKLAYTWAFFYGNGSPQIVILLSKNNCATTHHNSGNILFIIHTQEINHNVAAGL